MNAHDLPELKGKPFADRVVHIIGGGESIKNIMYRDMVECLRRLGQPSIGTNVAMEFHPCFNLISDEWLVHDLSRKYPLEFPHPNPVDARYPKARTIQLLRRPSGMKSETEDLVDGVIHNAGNNWSASLETGIIHGPTGLSAINLAEILGASEVVLWGFDMWREPEIGGKQQKLKHYHDYYPPERVPSDQATEAWMEQFRRAYLLSNIPWTVIDVEGYPPSALSRVPIGDSMEIRPFTTFPKGSTMSRGYNLYEKNK